MVDFWNDNISSFAREHVLIIKYHKMFNEKNNNTSLIRVFCDETRIAPQFAICMALDFPILPHLPLITVHVPVPNIFIFVRKMVTTLYLYAIYGNPGIFRPSL